MKFRFVYLEPININAYRRPDCGIPIVTNLIEVEPDGFPARLCYEVVYDDGFKDYVPLSSIENGDFKLITMRKMLDELIITNDGGITFRT